MTDTTLGEASGKGGYIYIGDQLISGSVIPCDSSSCTSSTTAKIYVLLVNNTAHLFMYNGSSGYILRDGANYITNPDTYTNYIEIVGWLDEAIRFFFG